MSRDNQPVRLHMVGNAHIDPMWIWDWREGMHEVLQTFRSAVDRLDEEPSLTFTASSASYYHWVEQVSPELFGRIKELVVQGRWIVTGGQWVDRTAICRAVSRSAVSLSSASGIWPSTSGSPPRSGTTSICSVMPARCPSCWSAAASSRTS